jgi:hypothetical protein
MQSSHDYNILFSYLWQDLGKYFRQDTLELGQRLQGHEGYLRGVHQQSMALYDCIDLTPRERQAAHSLAVLTRYQEILFCHQHTSETLTIEQSNGIDSLKKQLQKSLSGYKPYINEREADNLQAVLERYMAEKFLPTIKTEPINSKADWKEIARQLADEFYEANYKQDADPKLSVLSKKIEEELKVLKIIGPRGKTPRADTIKREALQSYRWYRIRDERRLSRMGESEESGEKRNKYVPPILVEKNSNKSVS